MYLAVCFSGLLVYTILALVRSVSEALPLLVVMVLVSLGVVSKLVRRKCGGKVTKVTKPAAGTFKRLSPYLNR